MAERLVIRRLYEEQIRGDVVLRYDDDISLGGGAKDRLQELGAPEELLKAFRGSFSVRPSGFDKYALREAPGWCWRGDCWRLPATEETVNILSEAYEDTLVLDESAVQKVEELLGYDPSELEGQVLLRGGGMHWEQDASALAKADELRGDLREMREAVQRLRDQIEDEEEEDGEEESEEEQHEEEPDRERGVDIVAVLVRIHESLSAVDEHSQSLTAMQTAIRMSISALEDRLRALSDTFAERLAGIESRLVPEGADDGSDAPDKAIAGNAIAEAILDEEACRASLEETIEGFRLLDAKVQYILVDGLKLRQFCDLHGMTDWTAIVNYCQRALEIEAVNRILLPLRAHARACTPGPTFDDDRTRRNVFGQQRRFEDLRHILLGATGAGRQPASENDRTALMNLVREAFPNDHGAILEDIQQEIEEFWQSYRNPASHDAILERRAAGHAWCIVVEGQSNSPGLLARLLRIEAAAR